MLDDSFRLIGSDADVVVAGDCAVAAAHYLSLAGWAAARFGAEHRVLAAAAAGRSAMVEALGARKFISGTEVCVRVCVCACACGGVLCSVCWCV